MAAHLRNECSTTELHRLIVPCERANYNLNPHRLSSTFLSRLISTGLPNTTTPTLFEQYYFMHSPNCADSISTITLQYGKIALNIRLLFSLETYLHAFPVIGNDESA